MSHRFRPKQIALGHSLPEAEPEVREFVPQANNVPQFQFALDSLMRVKPRSDNEFEEDEE